MDKWTVILVHGVGDAAPGSILADSSKGMPGIAGERADLVLNGCRFPTLAISNHPVFERLIEVNWADVASPKRTLLDLARYGVRVVAALLHVATTLPGAGWAKGFSWTYRFLFEAVLVYCLYPALAAMLLKVTPSEPGQWGIAVGAPVAVAALTRYLKRFHWPLWAGVVWAAMMLAGNLAVMCEVISADALVRVATQVYLGSQVVTAGCLVAALLAIACRRAWTSDRGIAAAALLYFPLFIVSAAGALLWALAFAAVRALSRSPDPLDCWQRLYAGILDGFGYRLWQVEWGFALLIGAVGVGMLHAAWRCRRHTGEPGSDPTAATRAAGETARNDAARMLLIGAVGYVVLVAALVLVAAKGWLLRSNASVLEVYVMSALRIVPHLPLMIGPFAVVTGIIVDVLFYVADHKSIGTAGTLRDRFADALAHATASGTHVAVVAHSQGSVIALDVIGQTRGKARPAAVFTAGSPIESLYSRFLGSTLEARAQTYKTQMLARKTQAVTEKTQTVAEEKAFVRPPHWVNFTRSADYIGAGQKDAEVTEAPLDGGTHTGYWMLTDMWSRIEEELSRATVQSSPEDHHQKRRA